jgi:hypothetical protein
MKSLQLSEKEFVQKILRKRERSEEVWERETEVMSLFHQQNISWFQAIQLETVQDFIKGRATMVKTHDA